MIEAFVLVFFAAALIIAVIVAFWSAVHTFNRPKVVPHVLPTPHIYPAFPWIRGLKAADPEWWASYSKEIPSVAYREFAKRNPSHPFSERVRRELA